MKKLIKKLAAAVLCGALVISMSAPVMADTPNVFVNFISAGQIVGKTVPAGSNVTAPAVPVCSGFTFCGFDHSLRNITANTTITAVYVSNSLGEAAIAAKKASLPTPAISATTVADPNAAAVAPAAATSQAAAVQTAATAVQSAATAVTAASATSLTAEQLAAIKAYQNALAAAASQAAATQSAATATQTAAAATQTAAVAAQAAATTVATGLPSWAVGLEGVDAAGAATAYNYLKNTKGLDDATIQANWGAFMHHYAGHGVAGW